METGTQTEIPVSEQELQTLEQKPDNLLQEPLYLLGFIAVIFSALALFFLKDITLNRNTSLFEGMFFIHYGAAVVYFFVLFVRFRFDLLKQPHIFLWLLLSYISCFSLNRTITIFQETIPWLIVYLVATSSALILYHFLPFFSRPLRYLTFFLLGAGGIMQLYFTIYLLPYLFIGLFGMPFFGISLHTFVPLYLLIATIRLAIKNFSKKEIIAFWVGVGLPLAFTIYFVVSYSQINSQLTSMYNKSQLQTNTDLPGWVRISQKLPSDWITERVLKTKFVYQADWQMDSFLDFGRDIGRNFGEVRQHDPLVMLGHYFTPKSGVLSVDERIKILEARHDARHQAQERLWSGKDLTTSNVISNIKIFPQYRLAYTEKTLQIHNNASRSWNNQQEAIYSFHLPEGSVVSSLSLWINGKEEPAYLTTKNKADSAYKSVVSVERRDPSVVHWQEGNTVSVRVFPCTTAENRQFKIGFTTPLRLEKGKMYYENIYFEGPSPLGSPETVQVVFDKEPQNTNLPLEYKIENGKILHEGLYRTDWQLGFAASTLDKTPFTFNGKSYSLSEYTRQYQSFEPNEVYLDINESWSEAELEAIWKTVKHKPVFVFQESLMKVTEENHLSLFKNLKSLKFSLFPLHLITNPDKSLLISKGVANSPDLNDLKNSAFAENLSVFLQNHKGIRLYNLGNEIAPFLKTLKEFRVFVYDSGDTEKLSKLIKDRQFAVSSETDKTVVLDNTGIQITETPQIPSNPSTSSPDHLLRLFAYNDILRKTGQDYFKNDFIRPELIAEAEKANIVTPVSSLIVLETKADYERFDIAASKNSLKNASMHSSGAVPEPHEWLLIGLIVLIMLFLWKKGQLPQLKF
jgi:XrtN system VIT domain protein